jgi:diguanylate cyclase
MTAAILWDILFVALIAAGGFAGGWCAHWHDARRRPRPSDDDRRVVQDVLAKVHALVSHVSEEMGQHGDYLAEINEGLTVAVTEESKLATTSLAKLLVANSKMRERLAVAEARLQEQSHTIAARAAEARTDSVTRLVNRQAFDDEIKRCFAAYRRQGRRFSVVLMDVDHFGRWVDRYGSLLGDEMLGRVAAVLRDNAREMDLVARWGDEQFAVLLPGTSLADAVAVASRMSGAVGSARFECGDEQAAVTLSAGAAEAGPEDSVTTLIARTEAALEASKSADRHDVHYHDGDEGPQSCQSESETVDSRA